MISSCLGCASVSKPFLPILPSAPLFPLCLFVFFLVFQISRLTDDFVLSRKGYNHCRIMWDGREDAQSQVVVHDNSTNGTWVRSLLAPPTLLRPSRTFPSLY
jgi:hypothetical protein